MKILKQFAIIAGVYVACEIVLKIVPVNFPANVLGMLVMFTLLCAKVIKLEQVEDVAGFFTANMGFFFVPAGVSIAANIGIVKEIILPILIVCVVGTALVFFTTVFSARFIQKFQHSVYSKLKKGGGE
jgi:putative effector of murein hydrolase LrgA (UPF0299 family)